MSPESMFKRRQNCVYVRLALEDWAELPSPTSPEWEALTQLLGATCHRDDGSLLEAKQNGFALYLRLRLDLSTSIEAVVESLRKQFQDAFWKPFIDLERFAWSGDYHAMSIRPDDTLASHPLEHPARTGKRRHMERRLKRSLKQAWHEAAAPEDVGVTFLASVRYGAGQARVELLFHCPEEDEEAWAAAHLNTRLRVPDSLRLLESVGWNAEYSDPRLVFDIPFALLSEVPASVEVWWVTDVRKCVAEVPCYDRAAVPEYLLQRPPYHFRNS